MKGIYISRVEIKNFRNFKKADVNLSHKQVLIGENGGGKTNFIRAIQLILDPTFSDRDRTLSTSDFHDSIEDPMKNGETIEIAIEIKGFETYAQIVAKFQDAVISDAQPTLRIEYKFEPVKDEQERIVGYQYNIYMGNGVQNYFTPSHRSLLNIQVIKALRDVEREMKSLKKSPVFQLVDQYKIKDDDLETISKELKDAAESIMELDEIIEIQRLIETKFKALSGAKADNEINLSTFDIDPERLLHTLQVLMGEKKRPVSEISLGLCNILYITLMLLLNRDRTVPSIIKEDKFSELLIKDTGGLLKIFYKKSEKGNFILERKANNEKHYETLYNFMNRNYFPSQAFTVLAVEEPEAHLHPVLQRIIYREVLQKSETSVIFTTHSTHLASVAPIESIVHIRQNKDLESEVYSTSNLGLAIDDLKDMERYLDARRGELYFGAGVILVEGIAEEYLIPKFSELLGHSLDSYRIVVCNINSTNFKPYVQLLTKLNIPWCIITDGDYYEVIDEKKVFHLLKKAGSKDFGYAGINNAEKILLDLEIISEDDVPDTFDQTFEKFQQYGCFVGEYTLEVDIMDTQDDAGVAIFKQVFSDLKPGGVVQQRNFDKRLDNSNYWGVLEKIEMSEIGKGRFSQRLSSEAIKEQVPIYIEDAIDYIINKVKTE